MAFTHPGRLLRDERGEMAAGFKFLILFGVAAAIVYSMFTIYYVKYSVTEGAANAARAAATEMFASRNYDEGHRVATNVANENSSELAEFKVYGPTVFVRLEHRNRLETLSKLRFLKEFIVTSATAEAEISRGNGDFGGTDGGR